MNSNSSIEPNYLIELIKYLSKLPGIGKNSARRIAYHLLQNDIETMRSLSLSLLNASNNIKNCSLCNNFSENSICDICKDDKRDKEIICIVETPADLNVIESSKGYKGLYYILMGKISPLNYIGPEKINFQKIIDRVSKSVFKEIILATNFTTEGETTAYLLNEIFLNKNIKVSRLASGIPAGSELEYIDTNTIAWAIQERRVT